MKKIDQKNRDKKLEIAFPIVWTVFSVLMAGYSSYCGLWWWISSLWALNAVFSTMNAIDKRRGQSIT